MQPPSKRPLVQHALVYGEWLLENGRHVEATQIALDIMNAKSNQLEGREIVFVARTYIAAGRIREARELVDIMVAGGPTRDASFHEAAASILDAMGESVLARAQQRYREEAAAHAAQLKPCIGDERWRLQSEIHARHQSSQPIKLHFGCGYNLIEGFINIDHPGSAGAVRIPGVFRRNDYFLLELGTLPIPANSVDFVFNEDFIEHVSQKQQVQFLSEALRVLKPGAVHRISTPNLLGEVGINSDFGSGWTGVWNYEWDTWEHVSLFTPSSINEMATMIGYREILFTEKNQSSSAFRCLELRPLGDRDPAGNIFVDLIK